MNRRSFAFWGIDLSLAEFAKALAAAGVLRGEGSLEKVEREGHLLVWRLPKLPPPGDASELAKMWTAYVTSKPIDERPRIELSPGFDVRAIVDAVWVHETLTNPAVEAASVYIRVDEPVAKVVMDWPLRIGVLPSLESTALVKVFNDYHYAGKLTTFVELGEHERECDLLMLPSTLTDSVASLASLPYRVRADASIVLGIADATPRDSLPLIHAIRTLSRSAGVAVATTPESSRFNWFSTLIDEISHNQPLDVALHRARLGNAPLIVASRSLAQWTLARQVGALYEKVAQAAADAPDDMIVLSPRSASTLGLPETATVRSLEGRLSKPNLLPWDREGDMASASVELAENTTIRDAAATPEARWTSAQVYAGGERVTDSFRPSVPHEVRVRVAPEDKHWMHGDTVFPDHELPEQDQHLLTVVFFEPQSMPEPQMGTIVLPRRGPSSETAFYFRPADVAMIEARITVLHQNRVLQTALLRGGRNQKIEIVTEAVLRPGMHSLARMERGDASLVINRDPSGEPGALTVGGGRASYISLDDVKDSILWFDEEISKIADDPELYDGLFAPATVAMLIGFAKHGQLLHDVLMDASNAGVMQNGERLQVVSAKPDARFPIEFVYDREIDQDVSSLCTNAMDALRTGKCENDYPPGTSPGSVICPLAFWGLRKVLERHVHDPDNPPPRGDFALYAEPIDGRTRLEILKGALLGASSRVDAVEAGGIARVEQALSRNAQVSRPNIGDWNDWTAAIQSAPTLLVLLVHIEEEQRLQKMEIGEKQFLGVASVEPRFVRDPKTNPPPLVLLLGCETGAPRISFQGFVARFRRRGAAVVVSSGSTVLGRQIVPVTEALLDELKTLSAGEKTSIGEAMRSIRRSMLAKGLPMVFALTAYGDADWRLA